MPRAIRIGLLRSLFFSGLSAGLLAMPFHDPAWAPAVFVGFIPLFFVLRDKTGRQAFAYSYLVGVLFFLVESYAIAFVSPTGFLFLVLYLGLYFGLFGWASSFFLGAAEEGTGGGQRTVRLRDVLFVAAFWVLLEYARSALLGGVPWALMGYGLWRCLTLIQFADVTGVWGVSFFVLFVNAAGYRLLRFLAVRKRAFSQAERRSAAVLLCVTAAWTAAVVFYGNIRLGDGTPAGAASVRVSVLQGNVPQDQKWNAKIKSIIFEKYRGLAQMSAADKPDLIVWPETSFPGYLEDEPLLLAHLRSLVRHTGVPTLVGAPTLGSFERGLRFYNSAVLFRADGEEAGRYHKLHLMPFGETIPMEPLLGWLRNWVPIGSFTAGSREALFEIRSRPKPVSVLARFGVLICFEDMFPGLVRSFCRNGADFLVNITNDAWFRDTSAPYQHAQASVFRAVENRLPVARAANTGYSCFISSEGRILSSVQDKGKETFVTGHRSQDLALRRSTSLYTRFGDWFVALCGVMAYAAYRDRSRREPYFKI